MNDGYADPFCCTSPRTLEYFSNFYLTLFFSDSPAQRGQGERQRGKKENTTLP